MDQTWWLVEIYDADRDGTTVLEVPGADGTSALRRALDAHGLSSGSALDVEVTLLSVPPAADPGVAQLCRVCEARIPDGFVVCGAGCRDLHNAVHGRDGGLLGREHHPPRRGEWRAARLGGEHGWRACEVANGEVILRCDGRLYTQRALAQARAETLAADGRTGPWRDVAAPAGASATETVPGMADPL
jgi:hypothetical protein